MRQAVDDIDRLAIVRERRTRSQVMLLLGSVTLTGGIEQFNRSLAAATRTLVADQETDAGADPSRSQCTWE